MSHMGKNIGKSHEDIQSYQREIKKKSKKNSNEA
jgi:hypothetical protein